MFTMGTQAARSTNSLSILAQRTPAARGSLASNVLAARIVRSSGAATPFQGEARSMDYKDRPSRRVIVVDDDAAAADNISGLLEAGGYAVSVVASGEEALAVVAIEPPRLVVLDVCLPGISGYEVCRELRNRFGEGLPIVFISAARTDTTD